MHRCIEAQAELIVRDAEQGFREHQVPSRRNGQELREPLDDTEEYRLQKVAHGTTVSWLLMSDKLQAWSAGRREHRTSYAEILTYCESKSFPDCVTFAKPVALRSNRPEGLEWKQLPTTHSGWAT